MASKVILLTVFDAKYRVNHNVYYTSTMKAKYGIIDVCDDLGEQEGQVLHVRPDGYMNTDTCGKYADYKETGSLDTISGLSLFYYSIIELKVLW